MPASEGSRATVVAQTDYFTVLDGVLSRDQCDRMWNYFQIQPLVPVDRKGYYGHWTLEDAQVLRGPTVGYGHKWDAEYPTSTPMDQIMKAFVDCADLFAPTVGRLGADWEVFSAVPTLYGAGQGLLWHRDAEVNAGSWVYYAHQEWNIEWGGELLLAHERDIPREYGVFLHRLLPLSDLKEPPPWLAHLDNEDANELLMERGLGSYVAAKPNRMVIIKGGTPHAVAKVRPAAGRNVRASIGGFIKKKGARLDAPDTPWMF